MRGRHVPSGSFRASRRICCRHQEEHAMSNDDPSRRGFLRDAGLVAGGILGGTLRPTAAAVQAPGQVGAASMSKGARFRAALATGQPLLLPVVESIMLA